MGLGGRASRLDSTCRGLYVISLVDGTFELAQRYLDLPLTPRVSLSGLQVPNCSCCTISKSNSKENQRDIAGHQNYCLINRDTHLFRGGQWGSLRS